MGGGGGNGYPAFYDERAGYFDPKTGEDLRVEVTDFQTYSTRIQQEMTNFVTNWNNACYPLLMACSRAFGNDGRFLEAKWTQAHHKGVMDAAGQLFKDMALGFQAIATAAMTIGVEYRNGDLTATEAVDAVYDTFYPDSDQNSLEKMREQLEDGDGNEGDGNEGDGNDGNDGNPPDNTATDTPPEAQNPADRPPDQSPMAEDTEVGRGDGKVTIPGDDYTDVPELEN